MVRVVLVDDQPLVRQALALLLGMHPDLEVVGQAADGAEAVKVAGQLAPDVVVMDVQMPTVDGITATREIVARHPNVRVLMLTTFGSNEQVAAALEAGARGLLVKDDSPDDLANAVRTVAGGDMLLLPLGLARAVHVGVHTLGRRSPSSGGALTPREEDILRLVGEGLSNEEIALRLDLAEPTVKSQISRLRDKLGLRDRAQMVVAAFRTGLVVADS